MFWLLINNIKHPYNEKTYHQREEMEQEEWLNVMVDIVSQINGTRGRPSSSSVWLITNSGDILNWDPAMMKLNADSNGTYIKEFQVFGKDMCTGFSTDLNNNFSNGNRLVISGSLLDDIKRFHINLEGPAVRKQRHKVETEVSEIPLHFNVRFDENVVVCNSKIFGSWGVEMRHALPLRAGQEFTIAVICNEHGFNVLVNEKMFCFFEHRLSPESITSVKVEGQLKLYKMEHHTKSLIVGPEEMIWRMMGGYLRRVECCQNEVVWGISHDHRSWVYTGGWGGGVLKGLGSNEGIHSMTDTQTYSVYENQRWNPLSGYSATGLPTDRHMWSDVSGKHKRTRDHTKLINRHWHWISEWIIDYNTPGGVDNDGWQYATDFPAPYHGKKVFTDCVRRRRWYRKAQLAAEGPWLRAGSTPLLDISIWSEGKETTVWAITLGGDAIYRTGVTPATPAGIHWDHVNSAQSFVAISTCGSIVWAVGRKGELYCREGITSETPTGTTWKLIEAPKSGFGMGYKSSPGAKAVSLSQHSAWVILTSGALAVRTDVTKDLLSGKQWILLSDTETSFKQVSAGAAGAAGEVWAASAGGALLRRLGVAAARPAGSAWQPVLTSVAHVAVRGAAL